MEYSEIIDRLIAEFPVLAGPIDKLRSEWVDEEPGPYIVYEDIFRQYVTCLLAAPPSKERDKHLGNIFNYLELMINEGGDIRDLGLISLLEGQTNSWLQAAKPFIGREAESHLDEYEPYWRENALRDSKSIIIDLDRDIYGVFDVARIVLSGKDAA